MKEENEDLQTRGDVESHLEWNEQQPRSLKVMVQTEARVNQNEQQILVQSFVQINSSFLKTKRQQDERSQRKRIKEDSSDLSGSSVDVD